jgi:ribosomal protein S18 acetylase RimI-like enzyme
MTTSTPPSTKSAAAFRPATAADARAIAGLYRIAADGVADYTWQQIAEPGESLLDVGERRYSRTGTEYSYENCDIAEIDGDTVGMLMAYRMPEPDPTPDNEWVGDPVLRPFAELELAGSYYISGVAVTEQCRGMGVGAGLIERAGARAKDGGMDQLSLICFKQNVRAARLYQRLGFETIDTRDIVPHALIRFTGKALLMAARV